MRLVLLLASIYLLQACTTAIVAGTVATVAAVNDPRTIGSQVDDNAIELQLLISMMRDDGINKHTNINAVSYNGQVLLVGQSPNQFLIDNAIKLVKKVDGVKKVHNQIKIGSPVTLSTKATDTWITTKVKSNLLTDDIVDGHNIKVVTENKIVYLMGVVAGEQAEAAAEVASSITGVEKVVKVFEH